MASSPLRTVGRIALGLFVLLFVFLLVAPFLFKGRIEAALKREASRQVEADVDWDRLGLSFITGFPNLRVGLEGLELRNRAPFDSLVLADVGKLQVSVNPFSLMGDQMRIERVALIQPRIHVKVLEDGTANYNIAKAPDGPSPEGETADFSLSLAEYRIEDAELIYDDRAAGLYVRAEGFNHRGSGAFTQDQFDLKTQTRAHKLQVAQGRNVYLRDAEVDLDATVDIDLAEGTYTLADNRLALNALTLGLDGTVQERGEAEGGGYRLDLAWSSLDNDLAGLLSLLPPSVVGDLKGIKTSGQADFSGTIQGAYGQTASGAAVYPGLVLDATVDDGRFAYPDLPGAAENLALDLHVQRGEGSMEGPGAAALNVDLRKLNGRWAGQPFSVRLKANDVLGRPDLDGALDANLDLATLGQVIPMPDAELSGTIDADLRMKGRLDDWEAGRYARVDAGGTMVVADLVYQSAFTPEPVRIERMETAFTPATWRVDRLNGSLGSSPFSATGRLDNLMSWWFRDSVLVGAVDLKLARMDLNEWLRAGAADAPEANASGKQEQSGSPGSASKASPASVAAIPHGIRLSLGLQADQVVYENLELDGIEAVAMVREQQAIIDELRFRTLDGQVAVSGRYDTRDPEHHAFDLQYDLRDLPFGPTAEAVEMVDQLAPIARYAQGTFRSQMRLSGRLDPQLEVVYESLDGRGKLQSPEVRILDFPALDKAGQVLKLERLRSPRIQNLNLTYLIRDGRLETEPFDVAVEGVAMTVEGSMAIADQGLDYDVDLGIPTKLFGTGAQKSVGGLLGLDAPAIAGLKLPETLKGSLRIGGTVEQPTVKPVFAGGGTNLVDAVKEQVVETVKEEVGEKVDAAKAEAIAKAKAERDRLVAEAQKQADKLKREAREEAARVKKAAYDAADAELAKIKNPLAKKAAELAANKAKEKADEAEQKALSEADARADALVDEARKKGDALVEAAEQAGGQ